MCICHSGKCRNGTSGDGFCECDPGWKGEMCDEIDDGYYDLSWNPQSVNF